MVFRTDGYDECTLNKMINGYQCTIQVHVDNLKLSHLQQELDQMEIHPPHHTGRFTNN